MKNGICHLCGENKKLCRAHIISESSIRINKCDLLVFKENAQRIDKTHPSGYWDDGILCQECDGKLGKYDKYEKDFSDYQVNLPDKLKIYIIPNTEYDYGKLKRFLVATLWRASISKLPDFEVVDLGDKYNCLCKKYLKNEIDDIGDIDIIISKLTTERPILKEENERAIKEQAILFEKDRIEGTISYRVIFMGYEFYYKVGQKIREEDLRCMRINPKELIILLTKYEDLSDYPKIGRIYMNLSNSGHRGYRRLPLSMTCTP